jgi:hypothetical protein
MALNRLIYETDEEDREVLGNDFRVNSKDHWNQRLERPKNYGQLSHIENSAVVGFFGSGYLSL